MTSIAWRRATAAALALVVAACGGGGGGDDATTSQASPTTATRTRIVTGAISGFGSIIVGGVRYDTTTAEFRIEDRVGAQSELRVGQVVRVEAEVDDRGTARARRVEQHRLLQGTVQAVDAASGVLVVSGQSVRVDDDTSFDESIASGSLSGVAVGDRLEVHGFASSSGEARATRIERADAAELEVEVTGRVTELDVAARRFRIGTMLVDFASATLDGFGTAGPGEGDLVEVEGREFLADGALRAQRVEMEDGGIDAQSGMEAEIEGLVTRFASVTDLDVAGQRVTTNAGTVFVGGSVGDLALDVKVEVEGRVDASGVLVATKVVFKHRSTVRLEAPVEAVDPAAGTLKALGLTIVVDATTRREDHESDDQFFALDDVRAGDWVEVLGYPDPSGSGRVIASRLERDEPEDEVELRGPASDLQAPRFRILGVAVETIPETEFEDEEQRIDAATFFAHANGLLVEVDGRWDGSSITADQAEIEREDGVTVPPPSTPPVPGNRAPIADAGSARTVVPGTVVTLDAGGSSDPDGDPLTFTWTLTRPAGSAAVLSSVNVIAPTFTADVAGTYAATVSVSDGQASSSASVTITAQVAGGGLDGAALYLTNCSGCHGPITAITRMPFAARNVVDIRNAINANKGGMGFLSALTDTQLQAIVDAINAANP